VISAQLDFTLLTQQYLMEFYSNKWWQSDKWSLSTFDVSVVAGLRMDKSVYQQQEYH